MRRLLQVLLAALVLTGLVVVLPVWDSPGPEAVPVVTAAHEVELGSVSDPAPQAEVRRGTSATGDAVPDDAPVLTVTREDVPEFSLVGVTWDFDPAAADTLVQVRVRSASGAWGGWTEVAVEAATLDRSAGAAASRSGTEPLWTGPSRGVQVELVPSSGPALANVRLDLIDPGSSRADAVPGEPEITDSADAAVTMPAVYGRAQWGADESIRGWDPEYAPRLRAATIHHTAGSNSYTREDVPAILRSIYRYHSVSLGWGDIGYNVLADKFGRLWEGRYGGLGSTVIGAHAGGFNTGTVGVSMIGDYDVVDTTAPMIDAVVAFLSWKLSLHGIDPAGQVTLTSSGGGTSRYASGQKVTVPTIFAHRNVGNTVCPGRYGYARMGEIRDRVAGGALAVWRIRERYDADAALRTQLGAQTTAPTLTPDGTGGYAVYQNGSLYWSPTTGVRHVPNGAVRTKWAALSLERGVLGYPTSDVKRMADGGWFGHFQGGSIYWSSTTGAHTVSGAVRSRWATLGWQTSDLGYPTSDQRATPDGGAQFAHFQGGSLYWSPATGARVVAGPVRTAWAAAGWERGPLGLPTSDVGATPDGRADFGHFANGSLYLVDGNVRELAPPVVAAWRRSGWERGPLGYPNASAAAVTGGGQVVPFERGSVHVDAAGASFALHGAVEDAFEAARGVSGVLGWPTSDVRGTADGRASFAHFRGGSVYVVDGVPRILPGSFAGAWARTGAERGPLGYPTSGAAAAAGGAATALSFERGALYLLADGTMRTLTGTVEDTYTAAGGPGGVLGLPTTDVIATPDGRGRYAHFTGGSVYATDATGAHVLTGPVRQRWAAAGWERGLGYPTSSVAPTPDGRGEFARFERGTVYWTSATGARVLSGPVADEWTAAGGAGELGYPTTDVRDAPDKVGQYAHFQDGSVYWTAATGAHAVSGAVKTRWAASGWERGLGYPTSSTAVTPDGAGEFAHFQRGSIYSTTATGARIVAGAFKRAWARTGWERGSLGYPTGEARAVSGGSRQDFQRGWITVSSATGKATVTLR